MATLCRHLAGRPGHGQFETANEGRAARYSLAVAFHGVVWTASIQLAALRVRRTGTHLSRAVYEAGDSSKLRSRRPRNG
jgi:hypothetical protein